VYNNWGNPPLTNCSFRGNLARNNGGGMYNTNGHPTLANCTFSGNSATDGGGMYNFSRHPTLTNCTFSGNSATDEGGGMFISIGKPTLTNSILWGNIDAGGQDESAQIDVYKGIPTFGNCDVQGWTGALGGPENFSLDPHFVDPDGPDDTPGTDDDNLRLTAASPCVDTGSNTAVLVMIDADGQPRIVDGDGNGTATVDRGAYEFQGRCTTDKECGDAEACTVDRCDLERGVCVNILIECPAGQVCHEGKCVGLCDVVDCNDHNACTVDSCDEQTGECMNAPIPCPQGEICLAGECRSPVCGRIDADGDGDIDLADFAVYQRCFSGPGE
jgi:hypothetical protein